MLIYKLKFEFSFEVFAVQFVTAVSGMYLTSGDVYVIVCESGQWPRQHCKWRAQTWLHNPIAMVHRQGGGCGCTRTACWLGLTVIHGHKSTPCRHRCSISFTRKKEI